MPLYEDLPGTYAPQAGAVFMPAATGVAATDAANFATALAAVPTTGGVIQLQGTGASGPFYDFTNGVTISKPVILRGMGGTNGPLSTAAGNTATWGTKVVSTSTTGNAITIASDAVVLQDFAVVNTAGTAPTAGAGVLVSSAGGACHYRGLTVGGFYRCVDVSSGFEWTMTECCLYDFVKTGLRIKNTVIPDGGDMGVSNNQFIAGPNNTTPTSCVEWCSGGGFRFTGNKINKRFASATLTIGLFIHPDDGIGTGVFTICGNSIEGATYLIYSDDTGNTGTGFIDKIVITGNELLGGITFARLDATKTKDLVIVGNYMTGVALTRVTNVIFHGNRATSATPLAVNTGVTGLSIRGNSFTTAARPVATACTAGSWYWDTTANKPAYSTGSAWVWADGTAA